MELGPTLLLVFACILLEAFFSGCEIGMIAVNRLKMEQLAAEGHTSAKMILKLLKSPERLFTTTSLGTNIAVVSSTALLTAFLVVHLGEWGDLAAIVLVAPLILFAGEILPKIVFQNRADSIMRLLVFPLDLVCRILAPIISLFTGIYHFLFVTLLKLPDDMKSTVITREQILYAAHPDFHSSELDQDEKKMIRRIFDFGESAVEQCMVPLVQTYAISDTATMKEANSIANDTGFSRLPVFHERMYNLIGILNTFDLLNHPGDDTPITDLIRHPYYVPPNKKLDDLLKELQQRGLHMAIVVDEYGGCVGIVTIEDLMEEIVGEIEDEYDAPEKKYIQYDDGSYLIDGDQSIDILNEELDLDLPQGDYETMAGLMIQELERIPGPGDQVTVDNFRLTVKEASKRKINSVILRRISSDYPPPDSTNGESKDSALTGGEASAAQSAAKNSKSQDA